MAADQHVAAFDFDGTLTTRDTFRLFLEQVVGRRRLAASALRHLPKLGAGLTGGAARDAAKAAMVLDLLGGLPVRDAQEHATVTAKMVISSWLRHDVTRRLASHQIAGHRIVIVSASFDCYVRHVAAHLGITDVLATQWETRNDVLTGRIEGENMRGPQKAVALAQLLGVETIEWAYGDSAGDRAMLSMATHATRIGRRALSPRTVER